MIKDVINKYKIIIIYWEKIFVYNKVIGKWIILE